LERLEIVNLRAERQSSNVPLVRELAVSDVTLFSCSTSFFLNMLVLHPIFETRSHLAGCLLDVSRILENFKEHPAEF